MSRIKLAHAIDLVVGPEAIARYESGEVIPTVDVMLRLVKALRVKPGDMVDAGN